MTQNDPEREQHLMPQYDDTKITELETADYPEDAGVRFAFREAEGTPPPLTESDKEALKDLVAHMTHLDPIDFDNMCTYLQLLYAAQIRDNDYANYIRLVKARFITPVVTPGTRRYRHTPERVTDLATLLSHFGNLDVDDIMAAFHQGVNPAN